MKHAILGVGGVGGLVAAVLAKAGDDVTLVLRAEALAGFREELSLESPFGPVTVPIERVTKLAGPVDVLWIAVKATQLESSLASIADADQIGAIVPLLNGIDHVSLLRSRFGQERVVPATIAVESERIAAGKIVHRSPFIRLNVSSTGAERLESTLEKLRAFGFTCQFVADEATMLWGKVAFLAPFAITTTASGLSKGEVASDPQWRERFYASVRETCAVANASGAKLDPATATGFFDNLPPGTRSSMQKDVAAGNTPELDAIAGPILRGATKFGIDVPVTRELVDIVQQKSAITPPA